MTQIAKLSANILAGAVDQVVPHGLVRTPNWIFISELNELTGPKKALYAQSFADLGITIGTTVQDVRTNAAAVYTVAGVFYALIATDDYWQLVGFDCTQNFFNICLLCMDDAAAMQIGVGTEAALLANVVLPDTPADSCVVAQVSVNPTTANFVGGTTALNAANVNAVYTDLSGHPDLFGEITLGSAADATNVYVDNSMYSARQVEILAACLHSIIS